MKNFLNTTALAGALLLLPISQANAADINPNDLLNLSLEQLSNIEVTSVSKKSEKANEAAAAIYVITQEDIRRSGLTAIPELLRMVPGMNVAQSGSHQWAVSSRGFNDQFANKLLVLIDGRSVYTPLYSGVYWDVQDTPLEDIERIEVIRGPGATVWGANAVNGVINIITKKASDTRGGYASLSAGNINRADTTVRYGSKISDKADVRVYAKYNENEEFKGTSGIAGSHDQWNKSQAGFRADWSTSSSNSFTLQGDLYRGGENYGLNLPLAGSIINDREAVKGGNILARWNNKISDTSSTSLQMYFDNASRNVLALESVLNTIDVDWQHVFTPTKGHDVVWGLGYRAVDSSTRSSSYIAFTPEKSSDSLYSAFVQDKITLNPDDLFLTLGSKFEHNAYTGFEYQPSARITWLVDEKQTAWTSVSRAVRTPNISGDNANSRIIITPVAVGPLVMLGRVGNHDLKSEEMVAYEAGYRIEPNKEVSIDASVFYNDYSNLVLGNMAATTGPFTAPEFGGAYFMMPISPVNAGSAHVWGGELSTKWKPLSYLELNAAYSLQQLKFDQQDPYGFSFAGKSPQQQFNIRSTVQLPHNVEWNTALYYVDELTNVDPNTSGVIPEYYRLDTRIAWKALDNLELSLVGQNLLDDQHQEFSGFLYQRSSQVPRTFYGNVSVKF